MEGWDSLFRFEVKNISELIEILTEIKRLHQRNIFSGKSITNVSAKDKLHKNESKVKKADNYYRHFVFSEDFGVIQSQSTYIFIYFVSSRTQRTYLKAMEKKNIIFLKKL